MNISKKTIEIMIPSRRFSHFWPAGIKWVVGCAAFLILFGGIELSAQVQRMAIPRGVYRIGPRPSSSNPGTGRGTLPSFCIDPHFAAPNSSSLYDTVLSGAGGATVKFPDGETITLQQALRNNKVKISGSPLGLNLNALSVTGPPGTEIHINDSMVLSAEPWLEKSAFHKYKAESLSHVEAAYAGSKNLEDREEVQSHLWNRIEVAEAFGNEGVEFLERSSKERPLRDVSVSKLGKDPILWGWSSEGTGDRPRAEIIRRQNGQFVRVRADAAEVARQTQSIFERMKALVTDDTSYVVLMPEGKPIFVGKDSPIARPIELSAERSGPIAEWLLSRKKSEKPNLVVVSERGSILSKLHINRLREQYGDRVRLYEDDDPVRAAANVRAQRPVKSGADLAVYSDASIKTGEILSGMEPVFRNARIQLLNSGIAEAGNIILVTGHKDAAFRSYLANLAFHGILRGKAIALLSCAAAGDREFARFLLTEGGATCIIRINDEVDSAAAREVLIQIAVQAKSLPAQGKYLDELMKDAAEAAAQEAASESFKEKIRVILDHSMQVSRAE